MSCVVCVSAAADGALVATSLTSSCRFSSLQLNRDAVSVASPRLAGGTVKRRYVRLSLCSFTVLALCLWFEKTNCWYSRFVTQFLM